jgi:hypothetical protein
MGGGNGKASQRPSHGAQKGTELDLDAVSECLGTNHRIIEGMKSVSEIGDFDLTKHTSTKRSGEVSPPRHHFLNPIPRPVFLNKYPSNGKMLQNPEGIQRIFLIDSVEMH